MGQTQTNDKVVDLPVVAPLAQEIIIDTEDEILLGANETIATSSVAMGDEITYVLLSDDDISHDAVAVSTLNQINELLAEQGVLPVIAPKLHPLRFMSTAHVLLHYIEIYGNVMDLGDFQLLSPNDLQALL